METCLTTNGHWGYAPHDDDHRPVSELIVTLARAAGAGANLLLNVGPSQSGTVPAPARDRLRVIGAWLAENGHAIYGTRAGRIPTTPQWTSTR